MSTTDIPAIRAVVDDVVEEVLGVSSAGLGPEARLGDDLEADSLQLVDMAMSCERRLGIVIPEDDFDALQTLGDVVAYLAARAGT